MALPSTGPGAAPASAGRGAAGAAPRTGVITRFITASASRRACRMRAVSRDQAGKASFAATRTAATRPPRTGAFGRSSRVAWRVAGAPGVAGVATEGDGTAAGAAVATRVNGALSGLPRDASARRTLGSRGAGAASADGGGDARACVGGAWSSHVSGGSGSGGGGMSALVGGMAVVGAVVSEVDGGASGDAGTSTETGLPAAALGCRPFVPGACAGVGVVATVGSSWTMRGVVVVASALAALDPVPAASAQCGGSAELSGVGAGACPPSCAGWSPVHSEGG